MGGISTFIDYLHVNLTTLLKYLFYVSDFITIESLYFKKIKTTIIFFHKYKYLYIQFISGEF